MMSANPHSGEAHGSLASYLTGFILSIVLTLAAYLLVTNGALTGTPLIGALIALAVGQLAVQLVLFLHLGRGSGADWNVAVFGFVIIVIAIVAGGSLWIMKNLNSHMTPEGVQTYITNQDGL